MADYTVTTSKHATLTPTTVDTITYTGAASQVEVLNRSSADPIYAAFGADPTVAGDNTYVIPAGTSLLLPRPGTGASVRLISVGAAPYSVTFLPTGSAL